MPRRGYGIMIVRSMKGDIGIGTKVRLVITKKAALKIHERVRTP